MLPADMFGEARQGMVYKVHLPAKAQLCRRPQVLSVFSSHVHAITDYLSLIFGLQNALSFLKD